MNGLPALSCGAVHPTRRYVCTRDAGHGARRTSGEGALLAAWGTPPPGLTEELEQAWRGAMEGPR